MELLLGALAKLLVPLLPLALVAILARSAGSARAQAKQAGATTEVKDAQLRVALRPVDPVGRLRSGTF